MKKKETKRQFLGCNDRPFSGKVYLIDQNRRRWVKNRELLEALGCKWPDDVSWVVASAMNKFPLGPPIPESLGRKGKTQKTMQAMREFTVSSLHGKGMEFGAAANPLPLPLGSQVLYADLFTKPLLEDELYKKDGDQQFEYVDPDIISSFDDMKGVKNRSLDFIIASHVIEHVRNPLMSLDLAWKKLRRHGKLALIIPKRERTLDKKRSLTTLEHLVDDFHHGSKYKDMLHVAEFYALAKPASPAQIYKNMLESVENEYHSMHYHVWNEDSFTELIQYVIKHQHPWKILINHPALPGEENYEFYVVLQKT